jgi:hypothetical protein
MVYRTPHGMVAQRRSPGLAAMRRWWPRSAHVSLNGPLRHVYAKLE